MGRISELEAGSAVYGQLPVGCQYCRRGSKLVLLVTGLCGKGCFYCPISGEKKGTDCFYADEMPVEEDEDVLIEAKLIRADGAGITGGDPLLNMERTERMIRLLKENFGGEHHIHLYTATMDVDKVERLVNAGLDEFRFHPLPGEWDSMDKYGSQLAQLSDLSVDVGVEVPVLPDMGGSLENLASFLDATDVLFLNLNELEFSSENYDNLLGKGYTIRDENSASIGHSRETGLSVLDYALDEGLALSVHYCSSGFKDGVQLRNRLVRRADTIARAMDVVTPDGTIIKGVIEHADTPAKDVLKLLVSKLKVDLELVYIDESKGRVEVAPWVLEKKVDDIPFPCYIVEEYPTWDRLEVERTPLKRSKNKKRK